MSAQTEGVEYVDGKWFSTADAVAIGVESALGKLTADLDLTAPNPTGYIGTWNNAQAAVEWRAMPTDEAEQDAAIAAIASAAGDPRKVIPAGVDCTPPCYPHRWFLLAAADPACDDCGKGGDLTASANGRRLLCDDCYTVAAAVADTR